MPDYIVREETAYNDLVQALRRLRLERRRREDSATLDEPDERPPDDLGEPTGGYFDDELRGYKLLRNSLLDHGERQAVLAITRNSCSYNDVAQALRGSWEDDELKQRDKEKVQQEGWLAGPS